MAGRRTAFLQVLVLCLGTTLDTAAGSQYDACRRVLLHSDFRSPCGGLTAPHKRPCMVSTPADQQYLRQNKIRYLYKASDVTGPMICAPRWNNTKTAECVPAIDEADNSVGWAWSKWSSSGEGIFSRRVILTAYSTDIPCTHVETKYMDLSQVLPDCAAAMDAGLPTGVTTIHPDGATAMDVYCDQDTDGGGWIVFQKRISASDFFLYWADYVAGFGDPATNYWLGLDNIHLLTSLSYTQLKIVMEYPAGMFFAADYSSFVVQDSSTDYTLQVSGYSSATTPKSGDSLTYMSNGQKFSTRDRENDIWFSHCAQSFKGGWWYKNCHHANLNGVYNSAGWADGMTWHARTTYDNSVLSSKMMLR